MLNLDSQNIQLKFQEFRALLSTALTIEKDISLINQYSMHLEWLDKIENSFENNDTALLKNLIEQESRSYGWSYLPNDHGEKVETAFWTLKTIS